MNKHLKNVGFLIILAAIVTGCSWQGTSYDRGGDQHNGSASDWNSGTGKPGTGANPEASPAANK